MGKKTVLVSGGAGYIGSHTVVELIEANRDVIIIDNFSNSKPEVLNRIEKITGKRPKLYACDLLDLEATRKVFAEKPGEFDPRKYCGPARDLMTELYKHKIINVLGSNGKAE